MSCIGIISTADDLLKNDGQKFLEMMETLAERRMQQAEQNARPAQPLDAESEDESSEEIDDDDSVSLTRYILD